MVRNNGGYKRFSYCRFISKTFLLEFQFNIITGVFHKSLNKHIHVITKRNPLGSGSFIARGKGNLDSWNSSSHGAGRRLSRTKAHADNSQNDFVEGMDGILCDTYPSVKDEAPQAYKDLTQVMQQQESLTDKVHRLLPLINVKGFEKKLPKKNRAKTGLANALFPQTYLLSTIFHSKQ